jgi:hypothetical protein
MLGWGSGFEVQGFWIIGTRSRNTIHCSKINFFWHCAVGRRPGKKGSFARGVFQKTSNLRLHSKVPKFHPGGHDEEPACCPTHTRSDLDTVRLGDHSRWRVVAAPVGRRRHAPSTILEVFRRRQVEAGSRGQGARSRKAETVGAHRERSQWSFLRRRSLSARRNSPRVVRLLPNCQRANESRDE